MKQRIVELLMRLTRAYPTQSSHAIMLWEDKLVLLLNDDGHLEKFFIEDGDMEDADMLIRTIGELLRGKKAPCAR